MTILEARIRRRLFGVRYVQLFAPGDGTANVVDDVVRLRRTRYGLRLWVLAGDEVWECVYPWAHVTEARVMPDA